jgi:hypothetical protein
MKARYLKAATSIIPGPRKLQAIVWPERAAAFNGLFVRRT